MSLLDRPPHVVWVQRRETVRDASGVSIQEPSGDPIRVGCMVQIARDWSSVEESLSAGTQVYDMRVIFSRTWPGDVHSHIYYDGGTWEMVGAPQQSMVTRRTSHWRITMRWIGVAPELPPWPPVSEPEEP